MNYNLVTTKAGALYYSLNLFYFSPSYTTFPVCSGVWVLTGRLNHLKKKNEPDMITLLMDEMTHVNLTGLHFNHI